MHVGLCNDLYIHSIYRNFDLSRRPSSCLLSGQGLGGFLTYCLYAGSHNVAYYRLRMLVYSGWSNGTRLDLHSPLGLFIYIGVLMRSPQIRLFSVSGYLSETSHARTFLNFHFDLVNLIMWLILRIS